MSHDPSPSPPSTDADYAQWGRDTITHDAHAHYYSFIIQSISKPRDPRGQEMARDRWTGDPRDNGMDRDKWIRRSLIRACEATTSHYHGKYKSHPRYVNAADACGVLALPATTTTTRIRQLHGWVRIPHRFIAKDGLGNVATASISVRDKKKRETLRVPTPVAIFHEHITAELNTTNIWWSARAEHWHFGGVGYALAPKTGETRHWHSVEFQPAYLFGKTITWHKAA